jgi:hypothetical protein
MNGYLYKLPSGKATLVNCTSSGSSTLLCPTTRKETDTALREALILLHKQKILLTELAKAKEKLLAIQAVYCQTTSWPALTAIVKESFKES